MLNPSLNNFRVSFSPDAFPKELTEKYDTFLFQQNTAFKTIQSHVLESIQNLTMPGINLNTITAAGLNNLGKNPWGPGNEDSIGGKPGGPDKNGFPHSTVNATFPGTAPMNEIVDSISANITFRNSILNWCYFYELFYDYYKRSRSIKEFSIYIDMFDSARLPMIRFSLGYCFVATIPGLEFAANQTFNDTKTFDLGFVFNKFDVEFLVPGFKQEILTL